MSLGHGASIVRDGLVLHLDAAGAKSYPGSGTTWTDLSGNGNDGTLVNGPTYSSDNKGSFVLDGIDDVINLTTESFDVCTTCFFYKPVVPEQYDGIMNGNLTVGGFTVWWVSTSQIGIQYWDGNGALANGGSWIRSNAPNILKLNEWNFIHVKANEPESYYRIGINTMESTFQSNAQMLTPDRTRWRIGARIDPRRDNGIFSDFKVYNRILTEAEIKQNFEATRGRYGI